MIGSSQRIYFQVLALLIVLSAAFALTGQDDSAAFPSAESARPSGVAAFAELLRRQGYRVVVDRRIAPRLLADDVAIAFQVTGGDPVPSLARATESIHQHVADGGRAISFVLPSDFSSSTRAAKRIKIKNSRDQARSVTFEPDETRLSGPLDELVRFDEDLWWTDTEDWYAYVAARGRGLEIVADGLAATNRFLDQADNAEVTTGLVRALSRSSGRLVFCESTVGNVHSGLISALGPWASAAWIQFLFVVVLAVWLGGRRFGLPSFARKPQTGRRELVDAMAYALFLRKEKLPPDE